MEKEKIVKKYETTNTVREGATLEKVQHSFNSVTTLRSYK